MQLLLNFLDNIYRAIFADMDIFSIAARLAFSLIVYVIFHISSIIIKKYSEKLIFFIFKKRSEEVKNAILKSVQNPFFYFLRCVGIFLAVSFLPLSDKLKLSVSAINISFLNIAFILFLSITLQNFVSNYIVFTKVLPDSFEKKNKTVISFIVNILKIIIISLTVIIILNDLGYDITGLITGLGLTGLTFALAAQDTASNFFSGVMILIDKPFGVGDWISVGELEGVIEEINFRSCRVRTFDNALITVPNNKLSNDSITNWTKMNLRRTKMKIGLVYQTQKEVMQKIISEIETSLLANENIKTETVVVRFEEFSSSSLDILVQYHSYPIELSKHLALKEEVQYSIMDIVYENKADFAFNTFTVYNKSE